VRMRAILYFGFPKQMKGFPIHNLGDCCKGAK